MWQIEDAEAVRRDELEGREIARGEAMLFKTGNSADGRVASGRFTENYIGIAPDAAAFCVENGVSLVGLDYISVDPFGRGSYPAHDALLGAGIPLLEGINLKDVPPGRYTLICLPLKIAGCEASPVRAVLIG